MVLSCLRRAAVTPGRRSLDEAMKTPQDPHDPILDPLLDQLRPPPQPPLNREVWSRIAATSDRMGVPRQPGLWAAIEAVFRQPAFVAAFIVACGLFGLLLAEIRVSQMHRERDVQLVQSYMKLIDPLLAASNAPAMAQAGRKP